MTDRLRREGQTEASMHDQHASAVKNLWRDRATNEQLSEWQVTHSDVWQRWLEIELLKRYVRPTDRVLDAGCGNGYTTLQIAPLVREIVGVDYSEEMIQRAIQGRELAGLGGNEAVRFMHADVLELPVEALGQFDLVISERCLINLTGWEDQQRALRNLARVVRPGGRFLFIEGSRGGRAQLNAMRRSVGLEEMPVVFHNVDFDEEKLLAFIAEDFEVNEKLHFGVYDFISRIIHPLVVAPEPPRYESRFNEVAARLALQCQEFGDISRVLFLVLRRR